MQSTIILYYSFTGHVHSAAQALAAELNCTACQLQEKKRRSAFGAFTAGCFAALRGKPSSIQPIEADLCAYERIILLAPVWAGNPAPAFNSAIEALPSGKNVEVVLYASSGNCQAEEKVRARILQKGCTLNSFTVKKSA